MRTMTQPVEHSFSIPLSPVKTNDGIGQGSAASYRSNLPQSYNLSAVELRKVVDRAYSETSTQVETRDSSHAAYDAYDGITGIKTPGLDSESSRGMSSAFLQFNPSIISAAISHSEDEPKGFHHRLRDALDQFGLNSLEVETKKSLVTMVNTVNVRCSDPPPGVVGLELIHSSSLADEPMPTTQMDRNHPSSKPSSRRRKKSGTVLCLMPLPEGGFSGDQDLLTVRSAPTILQGERPMPTRRGNNTQPSLSRSSNPSVFGLAPTDAYGSAQQTIASGEDNIPNSSITVASGWSLSASSARSQTSGGSAGSGARLRTLPMIQRLSEEQLSPTSGRSQTSGSTATSGVRSRAQSSLHRPYQDPVSPISRTSRHTVGSPVVAGHNNRFDKTEVSMRRGYSERGADRFLQGTPSSPKPEKKELKKFFNAIFKHHIHNSFTPDMMFPEPPRPWEEENDDPDATRSSNVDTELSSSASFGSNPSGYQGQFR